VPAAGDGAAPTRVAPAGVGSAAPAAPVASPAVPSSGPAAAARPRGQAEMPAGAQPRVLQGQISALVSDPPGFTLLLQSGGQVMVRMAAGTNLKAGPDRPYRFDLLKTGDQVRVAGLPVDSLPARRAQGLLPDALAGGTPNEAADGLQNGPPNGPSTGPRSGRQDAPRREAPQNDADVVLARVVAVVPAGERPPGQRRPGAGAAAPAPMDAAGMRSTMEGDDAAGQ
jgi:hypothetical protein